MNILIVGNGSREHAIAWKIAQSPKVSHVYVAPGNAGTSSFCTNLDILSTDIELLARAVKDLGIELTIVGPESSLAMGIADYFQKMSFPVIGPCKAPAQIESSKVFAKKLMSKYNIPCANSESFASYARAMEYINEQQFPVVIKADGLAAGKGVFISNTKIQAQNALKQIMVENFFGVAGEKVIIEEYLTGKEVSLLAFTDGKTIIPMVPACDYKRIFDNDQGENTGGMGAYSPPHFFDERMTALVLKTILKPIIDAMYNEGIIYKGILYAGLMITSTGPKVLEFNARFGDPETQVILPRLDTDLIDIFLSLINNNLEKQKISWNNNPCVGVVLASGGYPGKYDIGVPISGLDGLDKEIMVFHGGTKSTDRSIFTDGGRVLTVVAKGENLLAARQKVYSNIPRIDFKGCYYRKDIALREVN